jgi:hypothetical protein
MQRRDGGKHLSPGSFAGSAIVFVSRSRGISGSGSHVVKTKALPGFAAWVNALILSHDEGGFFTFRFPANVI